MSDDQKAAVNRWLPTVIQVCAMLIAVGMTYGSLSTKMDGLEKQNDKLWQELYYLRDRVDGKTARL